MSGFYIKQSSLVLSVAALLVGISNQPAHAEPLNSSVEPVSLNATRPSFPVADARAQFSIAANSVNGGLVDRTATDVVPGQTNTSAEGLKPRPDALGAVVAQYNQTTPNTTNPSTGAPGTTVTPSNTTPSTTPESVPTSPTNTTPGTTTPSDTTPTQTTPSTTPSTTDTTPSTTPSTTPETTPTTPETTPGTTNPNTTVSPGRATRSGSSYFGVGGNIGIGSGDTALGDGSFAIISKIGLTRVFSVRPSLLINDDVTILLPITYDFSFGTTPTENLGFRAAPYVGIGPAISTGGGGSVDLLLTAGLDIPLSSQFTINAAVNATVTGDPAVGILLGVGYNFAGF